jgi:integrase
VELFGASPIDDLKRADIQLVLDREDWGGGKRNLFVATSPRSTNGRAARTRPRPRRRADIARRETGERKKWPDDLLEAGLQAEDDTVRLAVALLFYTGQRIGDVCAMRWSDMKDRFPQDRPAEDRQAAHHPAALRPARRAGPLRQAGVTLLTNRVGKPMQPLLSRADQGVLRRRACRAAAARAAQERGDRAPEAGCSVAETAAITGQTYELVEYYARQIDQAKMAGAAIYKLEQAGNRKTVGKIGPETRTKP